MVWVINGKNIEKSITFTSLILIKENEIENEYIKNITTIKELYNKKMKILNEDNANLFSDKKSLKLDKKVSLQRLKQINMPMYLDQCMDENYYDSNKYYNKNITKYNNLKTEMKSGLNKNNELLRFKLKELYSSIYKEYKEWQECERVKIIEELNNKVDKILIMETKLQEKKIEIDLLKEEKEKDLNKQNELKQIAINNCHIQYNDKYYFEWKNEHKAWLSSSKTIYLDSGEYVYKLINDNTAIQYTKDTFIKYISNISVLEK